MDILTYWKENQRETESGLLVSTRFGMVSGMRWCRPNATAVVALRMDLLNDDWFLPQRLRSFT